MKKAAVVTVSIILLVVLIGVNYLLLENSSKTEDIKDLETKEETKQETIQNLVEDLYRERANNKELEDKISGLEKNAAINITEIEELNREKLDIYTIVGDKNSIIYQLKKTADNDFFKGILDDWIDNINNKDYFMAYLLHNEKNIFTNRTDIIFYMYSAQFQNLISMEILEFKVRVEDRAVDEDDKNMIVFDVLMNIELEIDEEGFPAKDDLFKSGVNHFKVTMKFDMNRWMWIIWTIE